MSEEKPKAPDDKKSYYIGRDVGAGATVIIGEHITNIQQMFPKTTDGEFLAKQFTKLVEEIRAKTDLDDISKELAVEKTVKVADGIANAKKSPKNLHKAVVDANNSLSGKTSWIWGRIKSILTSEAAKKTIKTIAETAISTAIKAIIGA